MTVAVDGSKNPPLIIANYVPIDRVRVDGVTMWTSMTSLLNATVKTSINESSGSLAVARCNLVEDARFSDNIDGKGILPSFSSTTTGYVDVSECERVITPIGTNRWRFTLIIPATCTAPQYSRDYYRELDEILLFRDSSDQYVSYMAIESNVGSAVTENFGEYFMFHDGTWTYRLQKTVSGSSSEDAVPKIQQIRPYRRIGTTYGEWQVTY